MLSPASRRVQHDLLRPYHLHRTVLRGFGPHGGDRVLFRLETWQDLPAVLVQSAREPDWSQLPPEYLLPPDILMQPNPQHKTFEPQFSAGQRLWFRLRANPTYRAGRKRLAHLREERQLAWLDRKAEQAGVEILGAAAAPEGFMLLSKPGARLRMYGVTFQGLLRVEEPEKLLLVLQRGVGTGKAFGFGLLSLKPA